MSKRDQWYPARESQAVVGRIIELEYLHAGKSREAGKPVTIMTPVLESKVAGSTDVAHQYLGHLPDHDREEICARFPGAWENYEAHKGGDLGKIKEVPTLQGTPIDRAEWIAREKIAWLRMQGLTTVEQLAAISDAQMQQLGTGARTWAKKAKQYLASPTVATITR
jgi:hypothetical protein